MRFEIGRRALSVMLLTLACAGCAHVGFHQSRTTEQPVHRKIQPDPVVDLLDYARQLAKDTPEQREQAVRTARRQVHKAATARDYARLAIALGTPAQRLYTPDDAARYAQRAADDDQAHWSPAAKQYLDDYARLYREITAGNSNSNADSSAQQIAQLKAQLAEARHKLRELANIETRLGTGTP